MTTLKIEGMSCGKCVEFVSKALQGVAGVQSAQVDLEKGQAEIEGSAEVAALIAAVEDEGYGARETP